MFTKNKILLGLALALFTFAAPNRAQANPYFFQTSTYVGTRPDGIDIYLSPDFGFFSLNANPAFPFPYIYKWGFGWIWWNSAYEDAYGGYFWDYATNSYFYTDARYYDYKPYNLMICGSVGEPCSPDLFHYPDTLYTLLYSYTYTEWLFYYDISSGSDFRYFRHDGAHGGGLFAYPPCFPSPGVVCVGGG
jgi:hypothetical protein